MLWRKYAKGLIFINQYRINLKWLKKEEERKKGDRKKPVTLFIQRALRTDWRNTSITVWVLGRMEKPERKVSSFSCLSFSSNVIGAGHCPPYQESGWGPHGTHGIRGSTSARGSYQDVCQPHLPQNIFVSENGTIRKQLDLHLNQDPGWNWTLPVLERKSICRLVITTDFQNG